MILFKALFSISLVTVALGAGEDYEDEIERAVRSPSYRSAPKPWPNGIVPYRFDPRFTNARTRWIRSAMIEIEKSSCVRFQPWNNRRPHLYFNFCWASCYVTQIGWNNTNVENLLTDTCLKNKGLLIGYLLAVLGIGHQHARSDRDSYVKIHPENFSWGHQKHFKKTEHVRLGLPYDFLSVSHMPLDFASKNSEKTIEPIAPVNGIKPEEIGKAKLLSDSDIAKLNRLYRCDPSKYYVGNHIPGAIHWDRFREKFLNEKVSS